MRMCGVVHIISWRRSHIRYIMRMRIRIVITQFAVFVVVTTFEPVYVRLLAVVFGVAH